MASTKVGFDTLRLLILSPPQFFRIQKTRFGKSIKNHYASRRCSSAYIKSSAGTMLRNLYMDFEF